MRPKQKFYLATNYLTSVSNKKTILFERFNVSLVDLFVNNAKKYNSYEDLMREFAIKIPGNFAYDIADAYAKDDPDKRALVWCDGSA